MSATVAERPLSYEEERGKPMPSFNHGMIQANLIGEFIRNRVYRVVSELTLELAEPPNVTPDLCIFHRKPAELAHDQIRVAEPPLMAVEVLSPTQSLDELNDKAERLLAHGAQSVWIVLPVFEQVTILTREGRRSFHEGVVTDPATGLQADLAAVFS